MRVVAHADALRRAPASGSPVVRVLAGARDDGADGLGCVEVEVPPGRRLDPHLHGGARALVYVVSGRGRLLGAGEDAGLLVLGSAVVLEPDDPFGVENTGAGSLVLLVVLSPAGFEEHLRAFPVLAGRRVPDPAA